MATLTRVRVADIKAPVDMTGAEWLAAAKVALGIWGGMHHSVERDEEGDVSIGFDPATAKGGIPGVIRWLDSLDVDYTLTLSAWKD